MNKHVRFSLVAVSLAALAACAASRPAVREGDGAPAAAAAPVADASYDWHGLVLAPFGMLLKESPISLHEVLLFHDESRGSADVDSKDCYAIDGTPPRFVGRQPDQYLLCFDHDRLNRVEASVRLPADEAPQVFARACALWLNSAAPVEAGNACEGHVGRISFSAHLGVVPGQPGAALSMTLSSVAERDAP